MNQHVCPTQKDLQGYSTGDLPVEEASFVESHLNRCSDCCTAVAELEQTADDFEILLKTAVQTPTSAYLRETQFDAAIATIANRLSSAAAQTVLKKLDQQADDETQTSAAADSAVGTPHQSSATAATVIGTGDDDDGSDNTSDFGWCPDNYELLGEVARGGMGVVYRARQISADRVVALKVVKHGNPDSAEVERFLAEARAAARLHHPHIVPVYEVGEANGQPFFSMRLVDGLSLARRVADQPLDPRLAATLVQKVANAIQFAHEHQIIHRDIKPGNILLNATDEPFVTDFGLARVMDQASYLTTEGQVMGTPSYMPPEQALGRRDFVNERSDVYSLGAVLYFCMTGRPPFQAASSMATVMQLLNQEVVAPRQLNADVPADLETICLKCLQKDAAQRYESAAALANDLHRFLNNEPIAARPAGTTEKFVKWVRRHPAWTALGATGVIAMVATAIAFTSAAYNDELQTSLEQTQTAKRIVELRQKETSQALDLAEKANDRARKAEYFRQIALTSSAVDRGDYRAAMETFERIDKSFDNWEFRYLQRVLHDPNRSGFRPASTNGTLTMQIADNGQRGAYLETGVESHFAIFDPRTAEITRRIPLGQHVLVFGSINEDVSQGTIIHYLQNRQHAELWNLDSGSLEKRVPLDRFHTAVVSDLAGRWGVLLEIRMNQTNVSGMMVVDWEKESLLDLAKYGILAPTAVSFRKDGSRAYASTIDGGRSTELTEFELPEWKVLQKHSLDYRVRQMVLSNDAEELIMIGMDRRLHRFSLREFQETLRSDTLSCELSDIDLSPNGTRLAIAGQTGIVEEYDISSFTRVARHLGQRYQGQQVAYANDDQLWASGLDPYLISWPSGEDSQFTSVPLDGATAETIALNGSGALAVGYYGFPGIRLCDVGSGELIRDFNAPTDTVARHGGVHYLSFLDNDRRLLSMDWGGAVRLWDTSTGEHLAKFVDEEPAGILGGCLSADEEFVFSANLDNSISIWSLAERRRVHRIPLDCHQYSCAISPNGRFLAAGGNDYSNPPKIWDLSAGIESPSTENVIVPELPAESGRSLAFSPDGRFLAMGDVFNRVTVVSTDSWKQQWQTLSHLGAVKSLSFSPNSSRLVSCSSGGRVILFETETGQEIMRLNGQVGEMKSVVFSPDGKTIATCAADGVRIWPTE